MSSLPPRPSKFFSRQPTTTAPKATTAENDQEGTGPRLIQDIRDQIKRGISGYVEPSSISAVLDLIKNVNDLDDRKMLLEHALTLMSRMPDEFKWAQEMLQRGTVELLYNDLPHPPATYIGPQYSFRNIDGSFNNVTDPEMGKAGTPYARSVQQTHPLPQNMLPDAGLIFDTLLKRDNFVKHPAGLSSMMFSFAALVIHTVFRTSHENVNINETSSYVDLAPLYGSTVEASNKIRQLEGPNFGRGLLYNDTFAEDRLLLLPPAVCVLLVLFSRNHNYIAHKLLEINERDTWKDPKDLKPAELLSQDNEIFHTARLVNCAWFASAIFSDYFGSILGLVRQGSNWSLNPFGEMRDSDHKLFERGRGNVCSVEFNCLYRWHATTSEVDEKWIEQLMDQTFPNKSIDELKPTDFITALKDIKAKEPDVQHWTFGRMQRQEDGSFKTTDLAAIIKNATEHPASAFKARGTPHIMRLHEIMGIEANRRWGVCSLNEFRKFLGLKPYASFLEWNPDPEIAEAAERLYGDIERLELYVGLQAEEAKPVVDGAGLCPGYTISRAILSDAIALTRGDRFFTADYTPFNMTAWGYADCQRDPDGPGNGSMLGRLLLRTLPGEYEENSTYAWFPLQTPESMKGFLKKLDMEAQYKFERPGDPQPVVTIKEYRDIEQIMKSSEFKEPYGVKASRVLEGDGFFIATEDTIRGTRQQEEVLRALAPSDKASDSIAQFFYQKTRSLLQSKSFTLSDKSVKNVDIVRDVLRYAPLHWAATEIAGIQLKSDKHDSGVYTEPELYEMLADISSFLFLDSDPSKGLRLEQRVREHIRDLKRHIRTNLVAGNRLSIVGTLQNLFNRSPKKARHPFAQSLFEQGGSVDAVTNNILAIMVGATAQLSQCLINAVNFYMNSTDLIAQVKTAGANNAGLEGYIYESMRLDPPFRGIYREATSDQTIGSHTISKGQRVFVDIAAASHDPDVFPDPRKFDINRQSHGKYLTGDGATRCLGDDLTTKIMGQVIRAVFEVDNLRRAPGDSGRLKRYKTDAETSLRYEYLGSDQLPSAWPNSMLLQFDLPGTAPIVSATAV